MTGVSLFALLDFSIMPLNVFIFQNVCSVPLFITTSVDNYT